MINCIYCDKSFSFKDIYDKHTVVCEFFYQGRRQRHRNIECIEKIPSPQEMFELLQHLTYQNKILTEKVNRLETNHHYRIKKNADDFLKNSPVPGKTFNEWIKSFQVKMAHLEEIFQFNLTDGMKKCLDHRITSEGLKAIPIRSFKEKPGILYIYTDEKESNSWEICSDETFRHMIELLEHEITKSFCQWTKNQEENSIDKETEMCYLLKITGVKINKDRQKSDLKSWLLSKVSVFLDSRKN